MAKLYGILDNGNRGQKTYTASREISAQLKTHNTKIDTNLFADGTAYIRIQREEELVYVRIPAEGQTILHPEVTQDTLGKVM